MRNKKRTVKRKSVDKPKRSKEKIQREMQEISDDEYLDFEDKYTEDELLDLSGSEPRKPLVLQVALNNGYDILLKDVNTGEMYVLEKQWSYTTKGHTHALRLLGRY